VKALYSVETGKTLTSLSCMLWLTTFSRSEILMVSSNERAPALASMVSCTKVKVPARNDVLPAIVYPRFWWNTNDFEGEDEYEGNEGSE
jgi:hypothetical protein